MKLVDLTTLRGRVGALRWLAKLLCSSSHGVPWQALLVAAVCELQNAEPEERSRILVRLPAVITWGSGASEPTPTGRALEFLHQTAAMLAAGCELSTGGLVAELGQQLADAEDSSEAPAPSTSESHPSDLASVRLFLRSLVEAAGHRVGEPPAELLRSVLADLEGSGTVA